MYVGELRESRTQCVGREQEIHYCDSIGISLAKTPHFPAQFATSGFCAFLTALFVVRDWLADESIVFLSFASIALLGVAGYSWVKQKNTESEISIPDDVNLAFSRLTTRICSAFGTIGAFVFALSFPTDWTHALVGLLLAGFSGYYMYANRRYRKHLESNPRVKPDGFS